ncbi:MAG: hypothetical protein BA861_05285 [Desulfobacterales bacterium S3730MH5]|nr:MAG: hypothetical protein BA861_05285 [Desulfobacterales bacterium S3730MH5]
MPRPRKTRFVQGGPMAGAFRPVGIPGRDLERVVLPVEGLEALRLSDMERLDHESAAGHMNVSRQTFGRVLADARRIVTEALVLGKMIRIEGGCYAVPGVGRRGKGGRGRHGPGGF